MKQSTERLTLREERTIIAQINELAARKRVRAAPLACVGHGGVCEARGRGRGASLTRSTGNQGPR